MDGAASVPTCWQRLPCRYRRSRSGPSTGDAPIPHVTRSSLPSVSRITSGMGSSQAPPHAQHCASVVRIPPHMQRTDPLQRNAHDPSSGIDSYNRETSSRLPPVSLSLTVALLLLLRLHAESSDRHPVALHSPANPSRIPVRGVLRWRTQPSKGSPGSCASRPWRSPMVFAGVIAQAGTPSVHRPDR